MKKLRIISNGVPMDTRVYVIDENGDIAADISGMIRFVSWECDAADVIPTVTLNVLSGDVDLIGEIKELLEDGPK